MQFYKADKSHIDRIWEMIQQAKAYFKSQGIDQWQNGYPTRDVIVADVEAQNGYVMEENGRIVGTLALIFDGEPDYERIYEGKWLTEGEPYAAIHRVVVDSSLKGKGVAGTMMKRAEIICREMGIRTIKEDTHEDNQSMQRMLKKNGFQYCGVIYQKDGAKRLGFEKQLLYGSADD